MTKSQPTDEPSIGPVQEKDTNAKVRDMKEYTNSLHPFSDFFSEPDNNITRNYNIKVSKK